MDVRRRWLPRRSKSGEKRELFELTSSLDEIRERFEIAKVLADYEPRNVVEPTDPVPIIVGRRRERKLLDARWGLFPFWAKDSVHAHFHGVMRKPVFDRLIKKQRCVIPGTALATLQEDGRSLYSIQMKPRDGGPFGMAGLYEEFRNGSGEFFRAFTIVTIGPYRSGDHIRDGMPLLLTEEQADNWLNPDLRDAAVWPDRIHTPDEEQWVVHVHTRRALEAVHD